MPALQRLAHVGAHEALDHLALRLRCRRRCQQLLGSVPVGVRGRRRGRREGDRSSRQGRRIEARAAGHLGAHDHVAEVLAEQRHRRFPARVDERRKQRERGVTAVVGLLGAADRVEGRLQRLDRQVVGCGRHDHGIGSTQRRVAEAPERRRRVSTATDQWSRCRPACEPRPPARVVEQVGLGLRQRRVGGDHTEPNSAAPSGSAPSIRPCRGPALGLSHRTQPRRRVPGPRIPGDRDRRAGSAARPARERLQGRPPWSCPRRPCD